LSLHIKSLSNIHFYGLFPSFLYGLKILLSLDMAHLHVAQWAQIASADLKPGKNKET